MVSPLLCVLSVFQFVESSIVSPVQGLQHAFLEAALKGDLDKVKDLIRQGCPVSTTSQVKFALAQIYRKTYIACFHGRYVAFCPTPSEPFL